MTLSETARVSIDPDHIIGSRWAHDTAHRLADAVRKARAESSKRAHRTPKP
jgi:hypothetical protein